MVLKHTNIYDKNIQVQKNQSLPDLPVMKKYTESDEVYID